MDRANNYQNINFLNNFKSPLWFSQIENTREVKRNLFGKKIKWTNISEVWDWNNCFISAVKKDEKKLESLSEVQKKLLVITWKERLSKKRLN
jgi:hypothetical protein